MDKCSIASAFPVSSSPSPGLLGFLGLQLYILGAKGSINLPFDSALVYFAQLAFVPVWLSYVLVTAAAAGLLATG